MNTRRSAALVVGTTLLFPALIFACLWDYDTLEMEKQRFPDTMELITGKFLRHSKEFYEWRIQDRTKKIAADKTNLAYYDDLAVAYDKTGQHQKAIETILAKDQLKPGLYETEANLGTFYIHDGQLEKGLVHIDRALQINPNAHFGREKYQKYLVEYVLSRKVDGKLQLPLEEAVKGKREWLSFGAFLIDKNRGLSDTERKAALNGIQGMMKFGNHESPILLEALASLLNMRSSGDADAKQLAAQAYLKASYEETEKTVKTAYKFCAVSALFMQVIPNVKPDDQEEKIKEVEKQFQKELDEAKAWSAVIREDELAWIRDGKDVDLEFTKKYYKDQK